MKVVTPRGHGRPGVEVAACPHAVHVRDSKVSVGPAFAAAPDAWSAFLGWTG